MRPGVWRMSLCCEICREPEGKNAVCVETGASTFGGVCPRCVARLELERDRLREKAPQRSEDIERAIFDARRALGDQSFADKLPAIPDRGFVTIRFSTEYGVLSKAEAAE